MFEEICFLPLSIERGYLISWLTYTFTLRISNNTYFALTMIRFAAICLPTRMRPNFLDKEMSPAVVVLWAISVSLPAALFTLVCLVSAPGRWAKDVHYLQQKDLAFTMGTVSDPTRLSISTH